jgi:signal transduction histidine kinase
VADDGSGIDAQTQVRMFDAFFTTKGIGGSGLGLWISAEIMDRHQGRIRIRSSQRDGSRGTVVALFLPFQTTQPVDGCHP